MRSWAQANHDHQGFVSPKHVLREDNKDLCWIPLELEADVEYLMVEAAYQIWQATGDLEALKSRLPHLEAGLKYRLTDPTRWDAERGALKRPFTIDTWDFTYGVPDTNRRIDPGMAMAIMHGDNSGLYQACRQMAKMSRAAGAKSKARTWDERAEALRQRINDLCFNGRFYTHQILLQPVNTGVREEDILSLSNAYDINRGLPDRTGGRDPGRVSKEARSSKPNPFRGVVRHRSALSFIWPLQGRPVHQRRHCRVRGPGSWPRRPCATDERPMARTSSIAWRTRWPGRPDPIPL